MGVTPVSTGRVFGYSRYLTMEAAITFLHRVSTQSSVRRYTKIKAVRFGALSRLAKTTPITLARWFSTRSGGAACGLR
jgi:hypothetical protein